MNWTVASAGTARNVIPAEARATADIRVTTLSGFDRLEQQVRDRVKSQLIADAQVEVVVERLRPPLEVREPSRIAAAHARRVYHELGVPLAIEEAPLAATDAAFARASNEGAGARGDGGAWIRRPLRVTRRYIVVSSIEKRLYLLTRLIMDGARLLDTAHCPVLPSARRPSTPFEPARLCRNRRLQAAGQRLVVRPRRSGCREAEGRR